MIHFYRPHLFNVEIEIEKEEVVFASNPLITIIIPYCCWCGSKIEEMYSSLCRPWLKVLKNDAIKVFCSNTISKAGALSCTSYLLNRKDIKIKWMINRFTLILSKQLWLVVAILLFVHILASSSKFIRKKIFEWVNNTLILLFFFLHFFSHLIREKATFRHNMSDQIIGVFTHKGQIPVAISYGWLWRNKQLQVSK